MKATHYLLIPVALAATSCTLVFDATPTGDLVEDATPDVLEDAVQEDDVYRIEGGWQCGPFELDEPTDLGEPCSPAGQSCREGECIVFPDGAICTNLCSPVHCPEVCGATGACSATGAEFADETPQGLCAPRVADFSLCTFDEQCASDFCYSAFPVDGIRDFGWCLPTCEDTCEPVDGLESYCVPLDEGTGSAPNVCFVACDPNVAEFGQCPADLLCVPVDDTQGFCADYPVWLRTLVGDRRD